MDIKKGVAGTLPELSEWTLHMEFMHDIYEVLLKNFLYFVCFLGNYWKNIAV